MHELPVVETILETVLRHAQKYNASRVKTIFLEIGGLSDLEDEWMQSFFDYVSKDSLAHGAILDITRTPIGLTCKSCGHAFEVDTADQINSECPECGAKEENMLVSGREYLITNMEIMMPES